MITNDCMNLCVIVNDSMKQIVAFFFSSMIHNGRDEMMFQCVNVSTNE